MEYFGETPQTGGKTLFQDLKEPVLMSTTQQNVCLKPHGVEMPFKSLRNTFKYNNIRSIRYL